MCIKHNEPSFVFHVIVDRQHNISHADETRAFLKTKLSKKLNTPHPNSCCHHLAFLDAPPSASSASSAVGWGLPLSK